MGWARIFDTRASQALSQARNRSLWGPPVLIRRIFRDLLCQVEGPLKSPGRLRYQAKGRGVCRCSSIPNMLLKVMADGQSRRLRRYRSKCSFHSGAVLGLLNHKIKERCTTHVSQLTHFLQPYPFAVFDFSS